jgi:hypothetical protein
MAVTAAEQLRTFHITGHGLTGQMPELPNNSGRSTSPATG